MGGALVSIWISVLSFSMFKAHRLTFRLDSICTLGLMPPPFFIGRMARVGHLPPTLPGPTEAGLWVTLARPFVQGT